MSLRGSAWWLSMGVGLVATGCFSSFNVERYRATTYSPQTLETYALLPLVLKSAQQESKSMTWTPGFIRQTTAVQTLSAGQYWPAAAAVEEHLVDVLQGHEVVRSARVTEAMAGLERETIGDSVVDVAARTGSTSVIVVEVEDFLARPAGLENAQASGRTNLTCFGPSGDVRWALSAQVVKGPVGSTAAPSLTQFLDYAMTKMGPEIQQMLAR